MQGLVLFGRWFETQLQFQLSVLVIQGIGFNFIPVLRDIYNAMVWFRFLVGGRS